MQEILAQVFSYVWGVWRYRWLALVVSWVVAVGGWIWVWQLPEAYVATARIYVDTNSILGPLLKGLTLMPNQTARIGLLSRTLMSRPNLEKLMRMTDLDLTVTTALEKERLLTKLGNSVALSPGQKDPNLYSVRVTDPDRDTAKRIAQALITVFIEGSLSGNREDASGSLDFMDAQIAEYEERLGALQRRKMAFRQKHIEILGVPGGYYNNLSRMKRNLADTRRQLREEEFRVADLQRQIQGEDPLYDPLFFPKELPVAPKKVVKVVKKKVTKTAPRRRTSPFPRMIQSLEREIDSLLMKYTERHPAVRQRIAHLEEVLEEQAEYEELMLAERAAQYKAYNAAQSQPKARKTATGKTTAQKPAAATPPLDPLIPYAQLTSSPVYLSMRKMLITAMTKVAVLKGRIEALEERIDKTQQQVGVIPEVESQVDEMNRDTRFMSRAVNSLKGKRTLARFGQEVDEKASGVTFRVIDPPYVPFKPGEPNKLLLNAIVLAGGVAVGLGVSLLVSLLYPVIFDVRTLMVMTALPVLGSVSLNLQSEQKRREWYGNLAFSAVSVSLVLVFALVAMGQSGLLLS